MSASASSQPLAERTPHLEAEPLNIQHILAAVDFSEQSIRAAKYAAGLASQLGCRLSLLHVAAYEPYVYMSVPIPIDAGVELDWGRKELHKLVDETPELRAIEPEEIVLAGLIAPSIAETAKRRKADLLVMRSHGRGGVSKLALGSVAESVVRVQHRPILVLGPHCKRDYAPVQSIVLAVDMPVTSLRAVQYATSIMQRSGAELTVLHVAPSLDGEPDDGANRQNDLEALIPLGFAAAKDVTFKVMQGDIAETILRAASSRRPGIIVLGAKHGPVLSDHAPWTILSKTIRQAPWPVLTVPPQVG